MHSTLSASWLLALAAPCLVQAQATPTPTPSAPTVQDIQSLQRDMAALKAAQEAQLQALERRLQAAEAALAAAAANAPASPPPGGGVAASTVSLPAAVPAGSPNGFNPQLALILSGSYTRTSLDPAAYGISGFPLPVDAEVGPGSRGFNLAESELGLSANIDPWLSGSAHIALHPDDAVSVEEAFVQTTALGQGLSLKAGRFFSGIGYLNAQHAHTWDFVDNPLAYQALLGTQYGDDGVQARWLAPTDLFLEFGAELGRGRSFPGSDSSRNAACMHSLYLHAGDDVGDSHSWRAGLSVLHAKANDQALLASDGTALSFNGRTRVMVADAVWKWAPGGNATRTNFKLQGEWLSSQRDGYLTVDPAGANSSDTYRVRQSGWYVQGIYQFMPRWRLGLRTERLDAGQVDAGVNTATLAGSGFRPAKQTLMLDFNPSEFSRLRLQIAQDRSREGVTDRQVQLQYQMSLGAHGAHSY